MRASRPGIVELVHAILRSVSLGAITVVCALLLAPVSLARIASDPLVPPPTEGERWSGSWLVRGQDVANGPTTALGTLQLTLQAGAGEATARAEAADYLWVSGCEIVPYPIYRGSWDNPAGTRVIACWFLKRPDVWLLDGVYIRPDGSHGLLRLNMTPTRTDRFSGVFSAPRHDIPVGDVDTELTLAIRSGPVDAPRCRGLEATIWADDPDRSTVAGEPLRGTGGDDVIVGSAGADRIRAGAGNDTICARGGTDRIWGGKGNDRIWGGKGRDTASGGAGRDYCVQVARRKSCELR